MLPTDTVLLSVSEMTAADQAAERDGVPSLALMEAAGRAVVREIQARWGHRPVAVLCGPGNNGGDGFVIARLLLEAGWPVRVGLLGTVDALKGDAAANAKHWQGMGVIAPLSAKILDGAPLVVDALFGAGLNKGLAGVARQVVERINADALTCVAVDTPSGVDGDTGQVPDGEGSGIAPRCALTVTFFRFKPGHFLYPGRDVCGERVVADIGIPESVLTDIAPRTAHNRPGLWTLPQPHWSDHKYTRGHAVIVGSCTMTGAARLSAHAARRSGAGVVTVLAPKAAVPIYSADAPGLIVRACDNGADLDRELADHRRNAVLIGPGADVGQETQVRVSTILATQKAVVLDAGALTSFEDDPKLLLDAVRRRKAPTVLTPHSGEFARLFDKGADKLSAARAAAAASGAVIVLKGPDTVVVAPDGRAAIADNARPWLATGGTGDVLAGITVGILAQGMPAWEAASAAVWLLGEAGTACGRGLIAEDLPEALPKILRMM